MSSTTVTIRVSRLSPLNRFGETTTRLTFELSCIAAGNGVKVLVVDSIPANMQPEFFTLELPEIDMPDIECLPLKAPPPLEKERPFWQRIEKNRRRMHRQRLSHAYLHHERFSGKKGGHK